MTTIQLPNSEANVPSYMIFSGQGLIHIMEFPSCFVIERDARINKKLLVDTFPSMSAESQALVNKLFPDLIV